MSNIRSIEDWESDFDFCKKEFILLEQYENDLIQLKRHSSKLRNPILFDNSVKDTINQLPYRIPNDEKDTETNDHLLGMSNIIMYIFKKKLYYNWETVDDFKKTLKSLQVTIKCPTTLNSKKTYKNDWIFEYYNVEECINWYIKLINNGITELEDINTCDRINVMIIWENWYNEYNFHSQ